MLKNHRLKADGKRLMARGLKVRRPEGQRAGGPEGRKAGGPEDWRAGRTGRAGGPEGPEGQKALYMALLKTDRYLTFS